MNDGNKAPAGDNCGDGSCGDQDGVKAEVTAPDGGKVGEPISSDTEKVEEDKVGGAEGDNAEGDASPPENQPPTGTAKGVEATEGAETGKSPADAESGV